MQWLQKPKLSAIIERELYEANRILLALESATEHHIAMLNMQRIKVARLTALTV